MGKRRTDTNGKILPKNIYQRKNGRYSVKFTSKQKGNRPEKYFATLKEAQAYLEKARAEDRLGIANYCDLTVDQWYQQWFNTYKSGQVTPSTVQSIVLSYKNHIQPVIGKMKLADVKNIDCQKIFNNMRKKGLQDNTQLTVKAKLHNMFEKAVDNDLINKNPVRNIIISSKNTKNEPIALTQQQEQLFLETIQNEHYCLLYSFLLETGLRISECLGLSWEKINFKDGYIKIDQALHKDAGKPPYLGSLKTKSSYRDVFLTERTREILKKQRLLSSELRQHSDSWEPIQGLENLVFSTRKGTPPTTSGLNQHLKVILKKIRKQSDQEFPPITCHVFRHTFATRCSESGIPAEVTQKLMGHARVDMTLNVYTHQNSETLQEAIKNKIVVKVS
jgi:integrase